MDNRITVVLLALIILAAPTFAQIVSTDTVMLAPNKPILVGFNHDNPNDVDHFNLYFIGQYKSVVIGIPKEDFLNAAPDDTISQYISESIPYGFGQAFATAVDTASNESGYSNPVNYFMKIVPPYMLWLYQPSATEPKKIIGK